MTKMVLTVRQNLLYMPARVAVNLVGCDRLEIKTTLDAEIRAILSILARRGEVDDAEDVLRLMPKSALDDDETDDA